MILFLNASSKTENQNGNERLHAEIAQTISKNDTNVNAGSELKQETIHLNDNLNLNPDINMFQSNVGSNNGEEEEEEEEDDEE